MDRVKVAAGVIRRADGRVLVSKRPPGKHLAGAWEFPGGKVQAAETPKQALKRELQEELGVSVSEAALIMSYEQAYPKQLIELHFFLVRDYAGAPRARENQALAWEHPQRLGEIGFLPADRPLVNWLIQQTASLNENSDR